MDATGYWGGRAGGGSLLLVVSFALSLSAPAGAGTISVTTTFDQVNGSAPCSLREAVNTANQDVNSGGCTDANPAAADTIGWPPPTTSCPGKAPRTATPAAISMSLGA